MKASRNSRILWAVCALLAGVVVPGIGLLGVRLRQYWVAKYHGEFAQLPGAVLRHVSLANTNLHYANLRGADLRGADLQGSDLDYATLDRAHLDGANLRRANFWRCGLPGASLRGADLTGADLTYANLHGADLTHAKLTGALYHDDTYWPDGFDPQQHGAVFQVNDDETEPDSGAVGFGASGRRRISIRRRISMLKGRPEGDRR